MSNTRLNVLNVLTVIAALAAAVAAPAFAAPEEHVPVGEHAAAGERAAGERFPIDLAQLEAKAEERFNAADADGDGLVSSDEFAALDVRERGAKDAPDNRRAKRLRERRQGEFEVADRDGDGQLSAEEYHALPAAVRAVRQQRLFARLDADQDGVLIPREFPSRASRLARLDADGDGQITRRELRQARRDVHGEKRKKRQRGG